MFVKHRCPYKSTIESQYEEKQEQRQRFKIRPMGEVKREMML